MTNLASRRFAEPAFSGYRPARAIRPAFTAVAETRQRHLSLVHAGGPAGGQRFNDPLPASSRLTRRLMRLGLMLMAAGVLILAVGAVTP